MPIVNLKSAEVFGPVDAVTGRQHGPDYRQARGVRFMAEGTVACAATDLNGSTYTLAELPSGAILDPETQIDLRTWGFDVAQVGSDDAKTGLLNVSGIIATPPGAPSAPLAFGDAKWNKPLWEQLGLAADPGGRIAIRVFTTADAAEAGDIEFKIVWKDN